MHGESRLRIGFITDGADNYGTGRAFRSLFRGLTETGATPVAVCLGEGATLDFARSEGIEASLVPIGSANNFGSIMDGLRNARYMIDGSKTLAGALRSFRLDAAIVQHPPMVLLSARGAHMARVPGFWLMPNLVSDRYPFRLNARVYDAVMARYGMTAIANSRCTHASLLNTFARSDVSHLGIDPAEFDPNVTPAPRSRYGLAESDAVFGMFARLVDFKGQLQMIQALGLVAERFPDLALLIVGGPITGGFADTLRAEIARLGLERRVVLAGPSDALDDDLPSLYAMCDVVVNARIDPEPFGLSVIEGMLMAKPLLVHALGGPAETVVDGEDGWHVTNPTPHGFAEGLGRAMADRPRWEAIGQQAARHAHRDFTHVRAAGRLLDIIRSRTGRTTPNGAPRA